MLAIKLRRIGKKHQPSYRLVVLEKRSKLSGKYLEDLGWHDPLGKKHEFNKERVLHWLKIGAKPSDTVHNLLISSGIISGAKIAVHKKSKTKTESTPQTEAKSAEAKPEAAVEAKP